MQSMKTGNPHPSCCIYIVPDLRTLAGTTRADEKRLNTHSDSLVMGIWELQINMVNCNPSLSGGEGSQSAYISTITLKGQVWQLASESLTYTKEWQFHRERWQVLLPAPENVTDFFKHGHWTVHDWSVSSFPDKTCRCKGFSSLLHEAITGLVQTDRSQSVYHSEQVENSLATLSERV